MYIYIHMHIHMHIHIHIYICMYIHMHIHVHVHIDIIYIYIILIPMGGDGLYHPKKWAHSPGEAGEERDRGDRGAREHVVWGASVDLSGSPETLGEIEGG
jgi:hypothetical protein